MNLRVELERRLSAAMQAVGAAQDAPALVKPSARPQFGDYQANGCMAAAKEMGGGNPRELASKVVEQADLSDLAEKVEIAGPGFINITLRSDWLACTLAGALQNGRLGVPEARDPQTVVVDYSGPNLAKEMHVGHLRSTIIGDALGRLLEFLGHKVIRQNHVGDWGTQFGMLIAHLAERLAQEAGDTEPAEILGGDADALKKVESAAEGFDISDLEQFYRQAKQRFDEDAKFADFSRRMVVELQGGNQTVLHFWKHIVEQSVEHAEAVYKALRVLLERDDVRGESAYNEDLPQVVTDLRRQGLLTESEGAQCVFLDEFTGKDGEPLPVIVQKTGGGYLYATTDLAAMRYRTKVLGADRILYVTDSRQSLHFQQVFAVARKAGFVDEGVSLEHVGFGMMLGKDGRPFKTREGGTVKLMDLLDEAIRRAEDLVADKNPDLSADDRRQVAETVGIGAVKYADLSQNRTSDYVFSWDKMLSLDGNTAPYMQYAYARVRSIFRKGGHDDTQEEAAALKLTEPAERALGVKLAQLPETVEAIARECQPHLLCGYLFELAGAFMSFYESCPVLKADDEPTRVSRLALCDLTARVIRQGLELLGIDVLEQM
ncbi:MAG: arginine--tRNA ligase [Phycisphaerae bacterium]